MSESDWAAIEVAKQNRHIEQAESQQKTALKAQKTWYRASYADASNEYCYRKNIRPHSAKVFDSCHLKSALLVPLYNENLSLVNLQFIHPDGQKRFLSGGQKKCCFWWLGKKTPTILIAEGFATAASLHEYTGHQTFIAFDAGNMGNVAKIIRAKNSEANLIVCGDNDESGTGQKAARLTALAVGGQYLIPAHVGQDWNDVLSAGIQS